MKKIFRMMCIFLVGCSSPQHSHERKDLDQIYIQSGIEQYFLPNLPAWANVSSSGACKRKSNIRFLDYNKLNLSYKLKYEELAQLQLSYNYYLNEQTKHIKQPLELRPRDEENLFQNVLERVKGGDKIFLTPEFRDLNLIWIDPALNNKVVLNRLKILFQSGVLDSGFPIFVSNCLSQNELLDFVAKEAFNDQNKFISQEMFSFYNEKFELTLGSYLHLNSLFKSGQNLTLYIPKEALNHDFYGNFKTKKY